MYNAENAASEVAGGDKKRAVRFGVEAGSANREKKMCFRNRWGAIPKIITIAGILAVLGAGWCSPGARACDVPVFRYAIQEWPAAPYDLIVLHRGALAPAETQVVEKLREGSAQESSYSNLRVILVNQDDLTSKAKEAVKAIGDDAGKTDLPCIVLRYPVGEKVQGTVWSGPLTMENAALVLDSPARREIADRLLRGDAAVWVFLESGNSEKDAAAKSLLEGCLKKMEETLELLDGSDIYYSGSPVLPTPNEPTPAPGSESPPENAPPDEIRFSIVSVSRTDPVEGVLVEMLQHSELDLVELASEPMAFPIFGRGRALFALVGRGINEDNVAEACDFVVGACTCEAKELNPGTDLLIAADWETGLRARAAQQPLVGLGAMAAAASDQAAAGGSEAGDPSATAPAPETPEVPRMGTFVRKMLISLGVIFVGIMAFSVWALRVKDPEE